MYKKTLIILFTTFALITNSNADSDSKLLLKINEPAEVKDCFEKINRGTFAFNQALDGMILNLSLVFIKLPSPIKTGVSNS